MTDAAHMLTLCAVVRDEAALLPAALASVRGVVDAMVVVDTGSTDGSVEIAREAGAHVLHRPWADDFAAARNAGLAHVAGGWVLVLDGDEQLAPGAGPALRAALAADRLDCGLLALHEADALSSQPVDVLAGRARGGEPVLVPRLLRRTPDLAYQGIVAEDLQAWLRRGRRVGEVEAAIVHYGAVPELPRARERAALRLRLLERRCANEPEDAGLRAQLARELLQHGETARGREQAARAWRALAERSEADRSDLDVVLVATLHAFLELERGGLDEAAEILARTSEWAEPHPNLDLLAGALLESLALRGGPAAEQAEALAAARAAFARCLEVEPRRFFSRPLPGATSWAARTRLATVDLLCGRPDEALDGFDAALGSSPRLDEAHLGRLEALLDLGLAEEVLGGLEPWLRRGSPDAWTLASAAALALGSPDDASIFADRARDAALSRPWLGPHRALRLEALAERA